jgi:hypothetical protein
MQANKRNISAQTGALVAMTAGWYALFMQPAEAATGASQSIGSVVQTFFQNISSPLVGLIIVATTMLGILIAASGIFRLADSGSRQGGGGNPTFDGLLRIAGGAFLAALPSFLGMGLASIYGSGSLNAGGFNSATFTAPSSCVSFTGGTANAAALTCVAQNVAQNMTPIVVPALFIAVVMIGMVLVAQGLYTVAMANSNGGRQMPKGWVAKIVIGFLICNTPYLISAVESSMGVTSGTISQTGYNSGSTLLTYTAPTGTSMLQQWQSLIQYVFIILVMFGAIAVWRGVILLKAAADGTGQGSMGKGVTHIVGGVLIANAKFTMCIVMNTFMGNGASLGFC